YADWLEERGDRRGEYLRLGVRLAALAKDSPEAPAHRRRLMDARAGLDPAWLGQMEQPGVLRVLPVPFRAYWMAAELGEWRPVHATYGGFKYDSLPPLPPEAFRHDFAWLRDVPRRDENEENADEDEAALRDPAALRTGLTKLGKQASRRGLTLPPGFVAFHHDPDLAGRGRSCTGCCFNLPARLLPAPGGEGGHLLRFYSDSQGCFHWYLYLVPSGSHCVVGSSTSVGGYLDWPEGEDEEDGNEWYFCAPSFEAF